MGIFFAAAPAAVFLVAALTLRHGGHEISAGTIVAFTTLQGRLFWPVGELFRYAIEIRSSFAMFERIYAYIDLEPELREAPGAHALAPGRARGLVEFDHVTFSYPGAERAALRDVSLRIEPGQLAALVGPTGAGKTTLSYLVARLYDPDEGVIRIDGHDMRELTLSSLPDTIAMVTQETYLFHDTVRANLLYAHPDATDDEVESAACVAFIHDRILQLPEDTRRRSASAATASPAARSSGWRSPARCSRTRASSFSTRPPRRSIRRASASCSGHSSRSWGRGRRSRSPTGSRRSSPPT